MVLCNDAKIEIRQDKTDLIGDPTEIALLVCAYKIGITKDRLNAELPRVQEVPFTPERKFMTTIHMNLNHSNKLESYVKGACEVIMDRSINVLLDGRSLPLSDEMKARIMTANDQLAKKGLRVLALAYKELQEGGYPQENTENDLKFLGLVGMMDPPRTEAIDSIAQCKSSGINVIMITGDHELTAATVAREIG